MRVVWTTSVAALLLASIPARSLSASNLGGWVDACKVRDGDLSKLLESEVLLVDVGAVARNADDTYRLTTEVYTLGADTYPLCTNSRFYGQPRVSGLPFRSAVQVGPDLVLTAWHNSTSGNTPALFAIFGLRYRLAGDRCLPPDFEHIPAADVFSVTEVAADGLGSTTDLPRDFLLLRLDRNVSGTYPRVRRTAQGRADAGHHDRLTMISHPDRLAAKVDLGGKLFGYSDPVYTGPEVENLHALQWSSGGMVYNRDAQLVETVVRSAVSAWYSQPTPGGCWRVADVGGHRATNDSLADFAQHIPAFELLVTPLDTVVHEGAVGGPFSNPRTTRTIEAPATAPGSIAYQIVRPATSAGGPELLVTPSGPLQGTLGPGSGFEVEETIDANGIGCGEYEQTYAVIDATNGFTDVVRHVFRIRCP